MCGSVSSHHTGPSRDIMAREHTLAHDGNIARDLGSQGYHVFRDALQPRRWFTSLYAAYDKVSTLVADKPQLLRQWEAAYVQWQAEGDNKAYFADVPPFFKNRSPLPTSSAKRNKEYIQFCLDFAESPAYRTSSLAVIGEFRELVELMTELHYTSDRLFWRAIRSITDDESMMRRRLRPAGRVAPIVLKAIRYNYDPKRFATDPHYDKSALSLLLHSDDRHVSYGVAAHTSEPVRCTELRAPIDYPLSDDAPNHGVLISGLCFQKIGVGIGPSPHAVLPVTSSKWRHAIVAFYLVPYLDTTDMHTAAPFVNDLDPSIA